jgi:hypothetical protein
MQKLTHIEKHILRQVYWFKHLKRCGFKNVHLEKRLFYPKHSIQVDVYAEKENGQPFIIEIGDIESELKRQKLKQLAKEGKIEFLWEYKGFENNKMSKQTRKCIKQV